MLKPYIRIYHLFFGLLVAGTLIIDLILTTNIINFFSYFTILSNIMASTVFLFIGLKDKNSEDPFVNSMRGAIVVYMSITGIIFAVLIENSIMLAFPWISFVLHKIMPVAVAAAWIVYPPVRRLGFRDSIAWLIFPISYLGYTLVRGLIDHWYPYPFLNPIKNGYGNVFLYILIIAAGVWLTSYAVIFLGNKLHDRSQLNKA